MISAFAKTFLRDMKKNKDQKLLAKLEETIQEIEAAEKAANIVGLKKMSGAKDYYRIRIGDYRLGVKIEDNRVTFLRFMHRRDIYRYFP